MFNLKDLVKALTNYDFAHLDVQISNVVIDSRQAVKGSLFIALPGEHVDGHNFVQAAFNNGASAALVDHETPQCLNTIDLRLENSNLHEFHFSMPLCLMVDDTLTALQTFAAYWRKIHPIRTIGITGSVGKTTTKELTASVLSHRYHVLKNPGNRNNEIGLPLTLLELEETHQCAVLEMGFYVPGEIRTLCDIAQPHVGVITNIGTVHAERAGSQATIAKGKAELIESLPAAPEGVAVLNIDDPWVRKMKDQTQARIFSYGIKEKADLTASKIETRGLEGIICKLNYQDRTYQVQSPLLGEFSVYTILRAAAVAIIEGLEWDLIQQSLATSHVDLRMHKIALPNGTVILDDTYNASPASTIAALELLQNLAGRRIAILGDMLELGPYEQTGHESVGKFTVEAADIVIFVGERSKIALKAALSNGFPEANLYWFPDSTKAAKPAADILKDGDVVLVKGSNSMQMEKIITALETSG